VVFELRVELGDARPELRELVGLDEALLPIAEDA